jgi:hypothetical protein
VNGQFVRCALGELKMKKLLGLGLLLVGLSAFVSRTMAEEAAVPLDAAPQPSVLADPATPLDPPVVPPSVAPDPQARGLDLNEDGTLTAKVDFIEAGTLKLRPIPGATVSFVQNRKVAAQARTDKEGSLTVDGLKAWGVYSVFVNHPDWFAAFSIYVRPFGTQQPTEAEKPVANKGPKQNQLAFTSDTQLVQDQSLMAAATGGPVQAVPLGDFQTYMGQSEETSDALGAAPISGPAGMGGGAGGGAGGGGAAGGMGGAIGAAALAAGIAAIASENNNNPPPSSPSTPSP